MLTSMLSWIVVYLLLIDPITPETHAPHAPYNYRKFFEDQVVMFYNDFRSERQFATLTIVKDYVDNFVYLARSRISINGDSIVVEGASPDRTQQYYPSVDNAINYLVTSPDDADSAAIHSEEGLLSAAERLINNSRNFYTSPPSEIILFSWFMPCSNRSQQERSCRQQLIDAFNSRPLRDIPRRIVAFRKPVLRGSDQIMRDQNQFVNLMMENEIIVYSAFRESPLKQAMDLVVLEGRALQPTTLAPPEAMMQPTTLAPSETLISPTRLVSFQKCLIDCHGVWRLSSCAKSEWKDASSELFIDQLLAGLSGEIGRVYAMKEASKVWIQNNVGVHCAGLANLEEKTSECIGRCHGNYYYALPFNADKLANYDFYGSFPRSMSTSVRSDAFSRWNAFCQSTSIEGVLCSKFKRDKITVNGHILDTGRCSRNGKSYSWAYTPGGEYQWDYCCEDECVDGQCSVGNEKTQNCGIPGVQTVNGQSCRSDHPCGLHGKNYYWCYYDIDNWDYCCGPMSLCSTRGSHIGECDVYGRDANGLRTCGWRKSVTASGQRCRNDHSCSTHGKGYFWCYTDYRNNWDYCCSPHHGCDYHTKKYRWCYAGADSKSAWRYCS